MTRDDIPTPALLLDLDRFERNIHTMAEHVARHGKQLRPHAKTHKCPEIARRQIAAGARGVACAKLGEAEVLAHWDPWAPDHDRGRGAGGHPPPHAARLRGAG